MSRQLLESKRLSEWRKEPRLRLLGDQIRLWRGHMLIVFHFSSTFHLSVSHLRFEVWRTERGKARHGISRFAHERLLTTYSNPLAHGLIPRCMLVWRSWERSQIDSWISSMLQQSTVAVLNKKKKRTVQISLTLHGPVPHQLKELFDSSSRRTLCAPCIHSKAGLTALAHLQTQPPASFQIRRLEDFPKMKVLGCVCRLGGNGEGAWARLDTHLREEGWS